MQEIDPPAPGVGGKWDTWYLGPGQPRPYGTEATYQLAAHFLGDCRVVEDWGCGWGWFRNHLPAGVRYRGIDGSRSPCADVVEELHRYRPATTPDGVLLRHVLDHNPGWEAVLGNALGTFGRKLCLVFFVPLGTGDRPVSVGYTASVGVHDLSLPRTQVEGAIGRAGVAWWSVVVQTGCPPFGTEEVYFVTREPAPPPV